MGGTRSHRIKKQEGASRDKEMIKCFIKDFLEKLRWIITAIGGMVTERYTELLRE